MADQTDRMHADREAEDALQRAYKEAVDQVEWSARAVTMGLIAVGRCILAAAIRIEVVTRETRQ